MVLSAGGTTSQVSSQPRVCNCRICAGQLRLHVLVEHLEPCRTSDVDGIGSEQLVELAFAAHAVTVAA